MAPTRARSPSSAAAGAPSGGIPPLVLLPDRPAAEPVTDAVVCVVGGGYVGLVTAAVLAVEGREVRVLEALTGRCEEINEARVSLREAGLPDLVAAARAEGRLSATTDPAGALSGAGMVVIAVGTPPALSGGADLRQVRRAVRTAARHAGARSILVLKSSVPPGTAAECRRLARRPGGGRLPVVSCPEFLAEGSAVEDFRHPARVVVGGDDAEACRRVARVFERPGRPTVVTDATSAEMIKYASNAFLALKISFINEIAHLCELTGAEIDTVARGIGADPRIGRGFLDAGAGFGGSCFPKDMGALEDTARRHGHGFRLLATAVEVNLEQRRRVAIKVAEALGGTLEGRVVAVLGLAFKPGTGDVRQSPSLGVIDHLTGAGARVRATDPAALTSAAGIPSLRAELVDSVYECVRGADAVVLMTGWPQYRELDWDRVASLLRRPQVVDARNHLPRAALEAHGLVYTGIGRRPGGRAPRHEPIRLVRGRRRS